MSGEKPERRENGMQMIVAVDENWAIGLNGGAAWLRRRIRGGTYEDH